MDMVQTCQKLCTEKFENTSKDAFMNKTTSQKKNVVFPMVKNDDLNYTGQF